MQAGARERLTYEPPQGRRHFQADGVAHVLRQRPATDVPLVLVLDNAGLHRSTTVRQALPDLRKHNVHLFYLPPYSPELNAIEPVFRAVKHLDLPARRYRTAAALEAAVDAAFTRVEATLLGEPQPQPGLAA